MAWGSALGSGFGPTVLALRGVRWNGTVASSIPAVATRFPFSNFPVPPIRKIGKYSKDSKLAVKFEFH